MFGAGTLDRPWLAPGRDPMDAARMKMAAAFEFLAKLGVPYYCFHDRDVAPEGASVRRVPRQPRRPRRRRAGLPGADRRPAAVGHREPVHPSALPGRRRHEPRSRGLRLRRGAGRSTCSRSPSASAARTTCCGAAARATTRCSTRTSGARASSSPASCTWSPSTSTRSASRAAAHRAQADGAHQAPVRPRRRDRPRLPRPATGWRASTRSTSRPTTPRSPGYSFHHEVAYAVAHGHPGQHRRQPRRPAERLGHGPVPELRRGPGDAAVRDPQGRRPGHRRLQLRRQAAAPEHRPDRPVPRPHRRHRHARPGAARRGGHGRGAATLAAMVEARYAGWAGELGQAILAGEVSLADLAASVEAGEIDPERCQRPAGAVRERGQPAPLGAPADGRAVERRPRDRRLDHGDQGGPRRRTRLGARHRVARIRVRAAAPAVERAGPRALVGRAPSRRSGEVLATTRDGPGRRRGGRAHRPDARARAARRGRPGHPPRHPVERPADRRASAT